MEKIQSKNTPDECLSSVPFTAEVFHPSLLNWMKIKTGIKAVSRAAFPNSKYSGFLMLLDFIHPDNTAIILKLPDGKVAGYSYTEQHVERDTNGEYLVGYVRETAIHPLYQKKGGLGVLLGTLDATLRQKGYKFLLRDANTANGYADSLERFYGDKVVARYDFTDQDSKPLSRLLKIAL